MDTALMAMKRAAKAVLKDELRALRLERRVLRGRADNAEAEAQRLVRVAQSSRDSANRDRDRLSSELHSLRARVSSVITWAKDNRKGDFTVLACAEFVKDGPTAHTYGAGQMYINPFDRWQVSPAIR